MRNYFGFQMLNWIYDSFIKNNYIKILDIVEDEEDIEIDAENILDDLEY
jgi:hypothetical protein